MKAGNKKEMNDYRKPHRHRRHYSEDWKFKTPPGEKKSQNIEYPRSHRHTKSTGSSCNKKKISSSTPYESPYTYTEAEIKRQRRVVKYKAYQVEGQLKTSLRNSFRWVKDKYCSIVYGY
ncbi:hypothetical protein JCGZ_18961 [Jatropha curcas]|uniref:Uncharacterized protein n=1 Tax=Jatropha curcas TaxID=180498 RepID=A0A067JV82_JATCU|nr:hypothetical protein JCGZ_18961 [Jatropha curcas]